MLLSSFSIACFTSLTACPICKDVETNVVELDGERQDSLGVAPLRMACFNCGFVVRSEQPFLCEIFEPQIAEERPSISKDYGLIKYVSTAGLFQKEFAPQSSSSG
jgi:hypothetical protein